jgi:hypothetical protein
MSETPAGLKSMEHGAIGESRAKAFLLDRFWVLERSVDIHGADYLIQRRITEANFLDRDPPRLGIIQVKFIQDAATNIYIPKHYVVSKEKSPHDEFFVLVLTGHEDDERRFLLSARELATSCPLGSGKKDDAYLLAAKRLLTNGEFEITSKKRALDRIEHALKNADFLKNRKYIGASQYLKLTPDQIEHEFLLPLDNGYADIQKEFYQQKVKLQRTLFEMEDLTEAIGKILRSTDPEIAFQIFDTELDPYLDRRGLGQSISVRCEAFDDEDFLEAVKNHKQRLAKLKELALVEPYFDLLATVEKTVVDQVAALEAVGKSDAVQVIVEYTPKNLKHPSVTVKRSSANAKTFPLIKESTLGRHVICFRPWNWLSWEVRTGKASAPDGKEDIRAAISNGSWIFRRRVQREIDLHLLGKELVSPFA